MFKRNIALPDFLHQKARELLQRYSLPRWMVFILDIFACFLTFIFAYLLRFNFEFTEFSFTQVVHHGLITISIYAIFALIFRSYSGLIRHTTIIDVFTVIITTSFSATILFFLSLSGRKIGMKASFIVPISIILIHYGLITLFLVVIRIIIKMFYLLITSSLIKKKRVLIFGAGAMGVIVKRVIQSDVQSNYQIAGFLDNSKKLQGKKLNGIPVYSPKILSNEFLSKHNIKTFIFAIKNISASEKSEILHVVLELGLEVLETPAVDKWLNGQLHMSQIQKVKINDLLGRDPIHLNLERIKKGLIRKTILVTGAAGSIGSEIIRQLTHFEAKNLVLVDLAETPMFHLENELKEKYKHIPVNLILADITNLYKMEKIFQEFHPEIVFHAAAYKHVPLMESNPQEAIRVNVGGTNIIANLSIKYAVKKFVMISTDKAVNPTNVMGASKRICEIILQIKAQQPGINTQFVITRFGNVLGSNGSVIPIFTKQIEEGGPITVTHPEVTRYFMTIPEACQLVLEAGFMGKGGEIFVFDMGKSIKIKDLANQMIRLSGLVPDKDIKIVFTGLRPGEKLFEELLADKEKTLPTHHPKILIARVNKLNYNKFLSRIDTLLDNIHTISKQEVTLFLKEMVPEYLSNGLENNDIFNKH